MTTTTTDTPDRELQQARIRVLRANPEDKTEVGNAAWAYLFAAFPKWRRKLTQLKMEIRERT